MRQMAWPQQMRDIGEGLGGQGRQAFGRQIQKGLPRDIHDPRLFDGQFPKHSFPPLSGLPLASGGDSERSRFLIF
ncbi:hypothetical protein GCM10011452_26900 [Gemmobacter lanyuensis]|uniref:Uncharacterized protein n=1 Tax=Gemmobacter lanyuensis TaxID=1054497 RepID=A0A918IX90_9RHOB|nr:hypothetical protein GCM10011452_26900 [Gemmobacter lanyuensis]